MGWSGASWLGAQQETLEYDSIIELVGAAEPETFDSLYKRAVQAKQSLQQCHETSARIFVRRDLAAHMASQDKWLEAISHLGHAISIAQSAEAAPELADLYIQKATYGLKAGNRTQAAIDAQLAWDIATQLGLTQQQVEARLILNDILFWEGKSQEAQHYYDQLLTLPNPEVLKIETHRAKRADHLSSDDRYELWQRIIDLTNSPENAPVRAEAYDYLAELDIEAERFERGLHHFFQADQIDPNRIRLGTQWQAFARALKRSDNHDSIVSRIEDALRRIDAQVHPDIVASLLETLSFQQSVEGDFEQAYRTQVQAGDLRRKFRNQSQTVPMVKMTLPTKARETDQAAALAAVQNSLRESELTSARLRKSVAYLASAAFLLLAFALGTAYHFKRKAAAALATARDAAELRADRTHWQMLRYQLSPHFLFNALSSLSGLIVTRPESARRVVERLSVFCRLALDHSSDKHRTLNEELELLSAYLDVEQAGAGESLQVTFDISPETRTRQIPALLLQPLVENALKYGGQTAEDKLEIVISSRIENDELVILIANTGHWLKPKETQSKRQRVGINNVRERLAKIGASETALTHDSQHGWVRLTLRIPDLSAPRI